MLIRGLRWRTQRQSGTAIIVLASLLHKGKHGWFCQALPAHAGLRNELFKKCGAHLLCISNCLRSYWDCANVNSMSSLTATSISAVEMPASSMIRPCRMP